MQLLRPNPPYKRLQYIAKVYGKKYPWAVLDTFLVLADTVGIEHAESKYRWARHYLDQTEWNDLEKEGLYLEEALEELRDDPRMSRGRESDPLWPWVARELVRARKVSRREYLRVLNGLADKGTALALWQQQERVDLGRCTADDAFDALEAFDYEAGPIPQGPVVYSWDDGWTIQKMVSQEQLEAEGEAMQHCVGTYCEALYEGVVDIYSLRDPRGRPHATIEYNSISNRFAQVQGKQNRDPLPEYQKRVEEFGRSLGVAPADELTDEERNAVDEYAVRLAESEWDSFSSKPGFAIVNAEEWPGTVDIYDLMDVPPFGADQDAYANLRDVIEDQANERADERWTELNQEAMAELDGAVENAAEAVDEEGEEEDPDIESFVEQALEGMTFSWGSDDFEYAVAQVKEQLSWR